MYAPDRQSLARQLRERRRRNEWRDHRWEQLARWEVDADRLSGLYRLTCPRERCATCRAAYEDEWPRSPPNGFDYWPACPAKLRCDPRWQEIVRLYNASHVSPLSPWPGSRPPWQVEGLTELRTQMDRHQREQREEAARRAGASGRRGRQPVVPNTW